MWRIGLLEKFRCFNYLGYFISYKFKTKCVFVCSSLLDLDRKLVLNGGLIARFRKFQLLISRSCKILREVIALSS